MTQKKKETIGSVLMYIALALTAIYLVFAIISLFGIVGMKNDFAKLGIMTQKKKETIGSVLMYIALALTAIYLVFAIISLFGIVGMKNDFAKLGACVSINCYLFGICNY